MPKDKGKATAAGPTSKENFLRSNEEMDTLLIESMLEQRAKGNFIDGQLSTTGYSEVVSVLRAFLGPTIRKEHIKNRLKTLKDHFAKCYDLFNAWSGVAWDPTTQRFDAEPEVWKEIIEAKPEAAKWMRTKVCHYDKLYDLYAADRATGKYVESARDALKHWEQDGINLNDSAQDADPAAADVNCGTETHSTGNMDDFSPSCETPHNNHGTSSSKGSKRKAPATDIIEAQLEKMNKGINDLTDVMREVNYYYNRTVAVAERQADIAQRGLSILEQSRPRYFSEQDVWAELETFNISPEIRMKCYRFLCRDERARCEFFGVPQPLRLDALYHCMLEAGYSWM